MGRETWFALKYSVVPVGLVPVGCSVELINLVCSCLFCRIGRSCLLSSVL